MPAVIDRIRKIGQTYLVEGYVDGRRASFHMLAQQVEEMREADFREFCKNALPDAVEKGR